MARGLREPRGGSRQPICQPSRTVHRPTLSRYEADHATAIRGARSPSAVVSKKTCRGASHPRSDKPGPSTHSPGVAEEYARRRHAGLVTDDDCVLRRGHQPEANTRRGAARDAWGATGSVLETGLSFPAPLRTPFTATQWTDCCVRTFGALRNRDHRLLVACWLRVKSSETNVGWYGLASWGLGNIPPDVKRQTCPRRSLRLVVGDRLRCCQGAASASNQSTTDTYQ